eukprot:CAMPEP_0174301442 /NCGR_PEP_ID=MMETSP0809-20121228/59050_1 /TAXON_ID=73025 ORGANISM="Eutreptiella gymnastica-like, Strain CCMP1594" /NCGR_SAMPLE_ID=MMETSP0809 /ASSEMBLY_ACC=CAM_ASM_000658 /LENGTH=46 /DNA_ID= /DNA_START= /DNA_END= /DNA_ORIENTATION=
MTPPTTTLSRAEEGSEGAQVCSASPTTSRAMNMDQTGHIPHVSGDQ